MDAATIDMERFDIASVWVLSTSRDPIDTKVLVANKDRDLKLRQWRREFHRKILELVHLQSLLGTKCWVQGQLGACEDEG